VPKKDPIVGETLTLTSKELCHRISTVLRLRIGEAVQLYSRQLVLTVILAPSPKPKDTVCATVTAIEKIQPPRHKIAVAVGLLKKESFEEAVHHATVTGATHIVPLITAKSRKGWVHEREVERLHGIIVAASEQSKNRHMPELTAPHPLSKAFDIFPEASIIGLEAASKLDTAALVHTLVHNAPAEIKLFVGPEGGFTPEEQTLLTTHGAHFYRLTSTILRSQEAVCVATGILKAVLG